MTGPLLTDVGGTIGASVLSTPGMIGMMERTAAVLAYESLPEGSATVGFEVCIKHVAGAAEGATCTARAKLTDVVDGRKLYFDVEVARGRADDRRRHPPAPRDPGRARAAAGRPERMADYPSRVRIREVGPRDGFQNEPEVIPTAEKVRLIEMLIASGLKRIEVTSFVRPDVIPQLADGPEVLAALERPEGVAFSVLIPNERGLENALAQRDRFDEISVFLSASETHNRKNVNRSIDESLDGLERVLATRPRGGAALRGRDRDELRLPLRGRGAAGAGASRSPSGSRAAGCEEIGFGDTTGMANPRQVGGFYAEARERARAASSSPPTSTTPAARASPTRSPRSARASTRSSRASASSAAARCRRARPATSPPRTWSRCSTRWAIATGVDLEALLAASRAAQEVLGRPLGAHLLTAGPGRLERKLKRPRAFLRGMNLGGRRITNADLRSRVRGARLRVRRDVQGQRQRRLRGLRASRRAN